MKQLDEDIFTGVPMRIFSGYTCIGTEYPKGWKLDGEILTKTTYVAEKPKYVKKLKRIIEKND